jgi:C4-dicarboxylate-specific signal transduction histidine kinase
LPRHINTFVDLIHPDDRLSAEQMLAEYRTGSRPEYRNEFRLRHKDGSWRWILTRGIILHDFQGRAIRFAGTHTDITERVRAAERLESLVAERTAELRHTEQALRDAVSRLEREMENKLVNIDAIMASIAHEIRQPLAGATTNASAARRWLAKVPADTDEVRACLDRITDDCGRADEVFDSIRSLFRRGEQKREPVDVNHVVREVLRSSRPELLDCSVTVHAELSSDLPFIEAHQSQLHQVIYNLVQNAIEAMGGMIDRDRVLEVKTNMQSQSAIIVAVKDTGPGLDPKRMDNVFDAFVTTKSNGIGLGLAISRMIVERHGGKLSAVSEGKSGALFQVVLPISSI